MKPLSLFDKWRVTDGDIGNLYGAMGDDTGGRFRVDQLRIIASVGEGWDHVSVSHPDRCPTWYEMETVKRTFFRFDETAMQLHVPPSEHINCHPNCLHMWRPHSVPIPMPPIELV
jgi:hypothetical protein